MESRRIEEFLSAFCARSPASAGARGTSAFAVHEAVRALRAGNASRPHVWAAYIHAGV